MKMLAVRNFFSTSHLHFFPADLIISLFIPIYFFYCLYFPYLVSRILQIALRTRVRRQNFGSLHRTKQKLTRWACLKVKSCFVKKKNRNCWRQYFKWLKLQKSVAGCHSYHFEQNLQHLFSLHEAIARKWSFSATKLFGFFTGSRGVLFTVFLVKFTIQL